MNQEGLWARKANGPEGLGGLWVIGAFGPRGPLGKGGYGPGRGQRARGAMGWGDVRTYKQMDLLSTPTDVEVSISSPGHCLKGSSNLPDYVD